MSKEGYGTGSVWQEKSGKWRARLSTGKGERRSLGTFDTKEAADQTLDAALEKRAEIPLLGKETFYQYGEQWLERYKEAGVRDIRNMRSRWSTVVADAPFADLPIEIIRRPEVRDWARTLLRHPAKRAKWSKTKSETHETDRTISWQTAKNALSLVRNVFADALEHDLIAANPAAGIKLPKKLETSEGWTYLSLDEIDAVFALPLSAEQRTAFTVAIYQGLRLGEIVALRWEDVDLRDGGSMLVRASWDGATKTGRVRRIPVLAPTAIALRLWQPKSDLATKIRFGNLIFPSPAGELYSRGYDWGWGDRRYGAKDLPRQAGIARTVRFHDLRHTCASHLVSGSWGEPWTLKGVASFLGHSSIQTTERYAHLAPDALRAKARITAVRLPAKCPARVVSIDRK